ncbi:conserved hypothetical protein [Frankia canadensis]|uniref:Uncharacterized protein n=1 Tax=Frankia canadensis TaxID=1836972 RepID=A0A2I2KXN5_9ACTN|nr:hypothetical protein [Frankia canadensis]SNQ50421.1 conserved hypothetical protein [Frankia canadensis]SOU57711.1 conserved hypothetical protein [Frankia canadensis]
MIDERRAREIAAALLGRSSDDRERPWSLIEFPQGWLINETGYLGDSFVGSLGRVIEKNSGRIVRFPTRVPTDRILTDYESVVAKGRAEST